MLCCEHLDLLWTGFSPTRDGTRSASALILHLMQQPHRLIQEAGTARGKQSDIMHGNLLNCRTKHAWLQHLLGIDTSLRNEPFLDRSWKPKQLNEQGAASGANEQLLFSKK